MKLKGNILMLAGLVLLLSSCAKKKYLAEIDTLKSELSVAEGSIDKYAKEINELNMKLSDCTTDLSNCNNSLSAKDAQIKGLEGQVEDLRRLRDKQLEAVGNLTVLSKEANDNIKETLNQLESRDQYINRLRAAKNKADSVNLALAVNLQSVLEDGLADEDIEVKVDKTVVFINLSDKMLYRSGSSRLTSRAKEVLGKIAKILVARRDLEVMVEGYTDNRSISNDCMADNWDLSVKRATSVVRTLQKDYNVDPNRLIAGGRGEYLPVASNETSEGRAKNRRTRIVLLPQLNQFYDLLGPEADASSN